MELQEMSGNVVGQTDVTLDTDATKTSGVSEEVKDSTNDPQTAPTEWTKEAVVEKLAETIEKPVEEVKDSVAQLKSIFYSLKKQEAEKAKEQVAEEVKNLDEDDALEQKLKSLLNAFKEKRAAYIATLEAERNANYERKTAILEEIKKIIGEQDDINNHYQQFQQLQNDFKAVGEVPAEKSTALWKEYKRVTEDFYDVLKMNKDLRDLDFKKNLEAKQNLIEQAQALEGESDIISAYKKLQAIHDQWREIGPVASELREEIWTQFKTISTAINKRHQEFFENKKAEEKNNEDGKTALCEKIEAIKVDEINSFAEWNKATEEIKQIQEEWKKFGFASRKANVELFARFRKSCDAFFEKKAEYYKNVKDESAENLQKKEALCERAEALKDSTDWKKTTDEFVALQKEWKSIGSVPKKFRDSIWKRFISACDYFFEQKEKVTSGTRKQEQANLEAKKEIIAKLNAMADGSVEGSADEVKCLVAKWKEIGFVPFKEKDKINEQYNAAYKGVVAKFDLRGSKARINRFENSLEGSDTSRLGHEKDRLARQLEQRLNDLRNYESNKLFFTAKSAVGNTMLKEIDKKIANIKEDIEVIKKKISIVKDKM